MLNEKAPVSTGAFLFASSLQQRCYCAFEAGFVHAVVMPGR